MFGGTWTLYAFWNLLTGWWSVSTVIGCAAVAVAIFTPPAPPFLARFIPNLRLTAIYIAIGAFAFSSIAGKFYHDGLATKQKEWDAALRQEAKNGEAAGDAAERTIARDTPDSVRNDPRNRDNWRQ